MFNSASAHLQNCGVMQIGHSVEMDIRIPIQRTMGLEYYVMGFDVSIWVRRCEI